MSPAAAKETGRDALIWLAGQPDVLGAFLSVSGASPTELRRRADDPAFLGFVLDHLLTSDETVLAFAADAGIAPDRVAEARASLPGGRLRNWT